METPLSWFRLRIFSAHSSTVATLARIPNVEGNLILQRHRSGPCTQRASRRTRPVKMPARALMEQAQRTQVSPGPQVPLRGLAYEVGALGAQPGRSTESLDGATTVDYSRHEALCSQETRPHRMSERFVGDGRLRLRRYVGAR